MSNSFYMKDKKKNDFSSEVTTDKTLEIYKQLLS